MTELNKLAKINTRKSKRVGRGFGSGKGGHTSGRGQKGQKARRKIGLTFEGTKIKKSLLKRLPLGRGKGKFKPSSAKKVIINLKYLNLFKKDEVVNLESLLKKGILNKDGQNLGVKVLGDGELKVALKVALPCSKGAVIKIKKAGGEILSLKDK
jgi:large subunit ribosomal protein L15